MRFSPFVNIQLEPGISIHVPSQYSFFDFKGFRIRVHLISLTGAGPKLGFIGKRLSAMPKILWTRSRMAMLEVGSGIGRDAIRGGRVYQHCDFN